MNRFKIQEYKRIGKLNLAWFCQKILNVYECEPFIEPLMKSYMYKKKVQNQASLTDSFKELQNWCKEKKSIFVTAKNLIGQTDHGK